MTTRRAFRSQLALKSKPEPAQVDSTRKKVLHLERPGPGIVVTVPLHLLPEYLEIYSLQPSGIREPKVQPKDGPGEGILLVKRGKTLAPPGAVRQERCVRSAGERDQHG